eukprot:CAMPEP_0173350160 /NCGR_PEP_ID=MMETSP1144-20121109/14719_1 /TAXON_ID=483371 /ORGANISM="non described non described, Strain CCMP2298" /LENGTH=70 /DNA_ID=CAMNT_0014298055 /DNA_START=114 /DNA_END=323 /DNA_ORIENTATION=+
MIPGGKRKKRDRQVASASGHMLAQLESSGGGGGSGGGGDGTQLKKARHTTPGPIGIFFEALRSARSLLSQ